MSNISITIDSRTYEKFLKGAPEKMARIVQNVIFKGALLVEKYGKIYSPVDTGRMRASISSDISPIKATIAPHVNYAVFVHDGTRFITGRPFMTQAATAVDAQIPGIIDDELKALT